MIRFMEHMIDPYAQAEGPPPQTLWAFTKWRCAGLKRPLRWPFW